MNWYSFWLLFAQSTVEEKKFLLCETCQVLFHAESALEAYEKGLNWGKDYEKDGNFQFVGIEHLTSVNDEEIVDGTEISKEFIRRKDVWNRKDKLIPDKYRIGAIKWEKNLDTPIGKMMSDEQRKTTQQIFEE